MFFGILEGLKKAKESVENELKIQKLSFKKFDQNKNMIRLSQIEKCQTHSSQISNSTLLLSHSQNNLIFNTKAHKAHITSIQALDNKFEYVEMNDFQIKIGHVDDSQFKNSVFIQSRLSNISISHLTLLNCFMLKTKFNSSTIHKSEFADCNFSNCTFSDCIFNNVKIFNLDIEYIKVKKIDFSNQTFNSNKEFLDFIQN